MAAYVLAALALRLKIHLGESSLVFTGLWFGIYVIVLWLPSEKYKIEFWKKKGFEDLEGLLVSLRLSFVIFLVGSCIPTMYYLVQ